VKKAFEIAILCFFSCLCFSQESSLPQVLLKGSVIDLETLEPIPFSMIINKRTSHGQFADAEGKFSISVYLSDTVIISSRGYSTRKITLSDSLPKPVYELDFLMHKLLISLKEVEVFPQRKIEEIESDIGKLKEFNKSELMLSGISAFQSPITYFYQQYSRTEKSKRKVAELKLEEEKRGLLKELLQIYVEGKLIDLHESEFDKFIDFCNVNTEFLKSATQYEFIIFIKKKHADFTSTRQNKN
jgi:hypothetical protein